MVVDSTDGMGREMAKVLDPTGVAIKMAGKQMRPTILAVVPKLMAIQLMAVDHPRTERALRGERMRPEVLLVIIVSDGGVSLGRMSSVRPTHGPPVEA